MDWFLYDNGLRHERVKPIYANELVTIAPEIIGKPMIFCDF